MEAAVDDDRVEGHLVTGEELFHQRERPADALVVVAGSGAGELLDLLEAQGEIARRVHERDLHAGCAARGLHDDRIADLLRGRQPLLFAAHRDERRRRQAVGEQERALARLVARDRRDRDRYGAGAQRFVDRAAELDVGLLERHGERDAVHLAVRDGGFERRGLGARPTTSTSAKRPSCGACVTSVTR